jgi:ribosome-associated translation inhibitor RaiA
MELFIRTDSIELTETLRDLVTRQIRLALDKFGDRIVDAFVYLKHLSHVKGDGNMLCLVSVRVRGQSEMVIRETASTEAAALDRAARRVKHRVSAALRDADGPSTEFTRLTSSAA